MKYHYRDGVTFDRKRPTWILWLVLTIVCIAGVYVAANYLAPQLVSMPLSDKSTPDATMNTMQATKPKAGEQHLYIPQLNVDLPIATGGDKVEALRGSAWQESEVGDIEEGTAIIKLHAIRFMLGATPWDSRDQSPFFNLDKLQAGNELYIDLDGNRYAFRVKQLHQEIPDIEPSDEKSTLLLIPVDQSGQFSPGVVVEAESAGVVATADDEE